MKALPIVLAAALFAVSGLWIITATSSHQTGPTAPTPPPTVSVPSVAAAPEPLRPVVPENFELSGRLDSGAQAEVRPALAGYVVHFKVNEGDFVQKGQLLVELGDSKLAESVTKAEAVLQVAKADLAARQARLANAEADAPRSVIANRGLGSVGPARNDVDSEKRALKADGDLEQAKISQAEAGLQSAKLALAQTQIVAPIAGAVAQRLADAGELSKPDITLMRIVDVGTLKMALEVPDGPFAAAAPGQEVHVTVESYPDRYFFGRVASKTHLPGSGTTSLSIEVGNPEKLLSPGMYAHARLIFDRFNQPRMASKQRPTGTVAPQTAQASAAAAQVASSLAELTKTLGAEAQELQRKETAAKTTAEASRQYFALIEKLIDDLRASGSRTRSNLERTADKIDNAPTLHVDDELLAFGLEVSKVLRDIAERRRAIARYVDAPDLSYAERAQSAANAIKSQGLLEIHNGLAEMRRKLTKKYDLEFLATITPTKSSATLRDTRRAHR